MFGKNARIVVEGYGDMTAEIAIELALIEKEKRDRDIALAAGRQAAIWRSNQGEAAMKEYGAPTMQVHESIFAAWESQLGPECWRDKGFRAWFAKKFPQCRVKAKSGRTTLMFGGPPPPLKVESPKLKDPPATPGSGTIPHSAVRNPSSPVILDARGAPIPQSAVRNPQS